MHSNDYNFSIIIIIRKASTKYRYYFIIPIKLLNIYICSFFIKVCIRIIHRAHTKIIFTSSYSFNTFTLDGDEAAISEAKDVLAKKGVTYQNVYFASDGEAGKFTTNIFAYPTTYVVDRNGNIVGDPIVGAITEKKQAETLQKLIDQALAADMG